MKNLQSYLGDFDFYLGKSSELPAEPLSADEPSQVASTLVIFMGRVAKDTTRWRTTESESIYFFDMVWESKDFWHREGC